MKKIVVIGATSIDYLASMHQPMVMHDSNPGNIYKSWGGVARNIAENLARLELEPTLITVLGEDAQDFLNMARDIKLKVLYQTVKQTPSYVAIHDDKGNLFTAVSSMDQLKKLTPQVIRRYQDHIEKADIVVLDANLTEDTIEYIFKTFNKAFYVDLVSSAKAAKFIPYLQKIHTIKINTNEGKMITVFDDPIQIGQILLNKGIHNIFLTLGKNGVYQFTPEFINFYQKSFDGVIINDTGAGDGFFAGTIFAEINNLEPLKTGTILSHFTLQSIDAVYKKLKVNQLVSMVKEK
ncbi:MAG TPA: PfkB family carbohydrate kinase [Acholeplasma sp.]|nr:PfkB family carbohydrate kinase [Acholeplasma sp.]